MSTVIRRRQERHDTTANWTTKNPVLAVAEWGYDTTLGQWKVGDGVSTWSALPWFDAGGGSGLPAGGGTGQVLAKASNADGDAHWITVAGGEVDLADLTADTVDTGQPYRLILFSNNVVKAIPAATPDPLPPIGLAAVAKLSSVGLSWTPPATPVGSYAVYRDGVQIDTVFGGNYRDLGISVGFTYSYRVQTIDPYGQRSALTAPVTAFIDPALNVAPNAQVLAWPVNPPTDGKTNIRVAAFDVNVQTLTLALEADEGLLEPTDDPSVWRYTPAGA